MGEQYPPTAADYAYDAADSARRLVRGMADRVAAVEKSAADDKLQAEALEVARIAAVILAPMLAAPKTLAAMPPPGGYDNFAVTRAMNLLAEARLQVRELPK